MEQEGKIQLGIRRIKDLAFMINEALFQPNKEALVDFAQRSGCNIEINRFYLILDIKFRYPDLPDQILMQISVINEFEISDIGHYIIEDKLKLPPNVFITIVSLAVGHARALLSKNTAGTFYQDTFVPIMNPQDMAKQLFPFAFEQPEKPISELPESKKIKAGETKTQKKK